MMRTTHGTGSQRESSGYTVRLAMVAAIAVTIAMPSQSAAQAPSETPPAAFHELPLLLSLGDRMTVTDDTGRELQGELIDLSPSALSVLVDDTRYDLQETDIATVRQRRPDSLKDGALWGFMAGAAIISGLMLSSGCSFHATGVLAAIGVYGGLGAGIGAGVDSAHVGSRVVYDTRGSSRRVSVAPLISRDRKGVAVSLGF